MSDTEQLIALDGRSGWRYECGTGKLFHNAGWLDDGRIEYRSHYGHLRLVKEEDDGRDDQRRARDDHQ